MEAPTFGLRAGSTEAITGFGDLDCRRVPVLAQSSKGTTFTRWIPVGMPRIPPKFLDCVCYLYRSKVEADAGEEFGGTGFLIGVPSRIPGWAHSYVVTNHHVACTGGASVVRLNTKNGGADVFAFEPDEWHFDPQFDVAVCPIALNRTIHQTAPIVTSMFVTKEMLEKEQIGVGDDVFMLGRFVDHDGGISNRPAARFGNISVMPSEIKQQGGRGSPGACR